MYRTWYGYTVVELLPRSVAVLHLAAGGCWTDVVLVTFGRLQALPAPSG